MMRVVILTLIFFVSCAGKPLRNTIAPSSPQLGAGVMSLFSPTGEWGHACPCDGEVLTAGHVAWDSDNYHYRRFVWANGRGAEGEAVGMAYDTYRDLGKVRIIDGEPAYHKKALGRPDVGDTVYWVEYKPKAKEAMLTYVRKAKVLYYRAGYVGLSESPSRGASGSCLFNDAGEVVGVVVWGIRRGADTAGIATLVIP